MENNTIIESVKYMDFFLTGTPYKLILSLIIILSGFVVGKLINKLLSRFLKEIELNSIFKTNFKISFNIEKLIINLITFTIYSLSLIYALYQIGLARIILYILFLIFMLLIVFSMALGIRDFFPNLFGGIQISKKKYFKEGNIIEIDNIKGKVTKLNLFHTEVTTKNGDVIYIPNSLVSKKIIKRKKI